MSTLKQAIRAKNAAWGSLAAADLYIARRRTSHAGAAGRGTIPPGWADRRDVLEERYNAAWAELDALRYPRHLALAGRRQERAQELAALIRSAGTCAQGPAERETAATCGTFALWPAGGAAE